MNLIKEQEKEEEREESTSSSGHTTDVSLNSSQELEHYLHSNSQCKIKRINLNGLLVNPQNTVHPLSH